MSETSIFAFGVPRGNFPPTSLENGDAVLQRVLSTQADGLDECAERFKYAETKTISPSEAAKQVLVDGVADDSIYECTCVLEYILREIGSTLEDSTPSGSLSNNMDFWLDDFTEIFEAAGLKALAKNWNIQNVALTSSGISQDWPTVSLLGENELRSCHDELGKANFVALLPTLPQKLFTQKDDDGTAQIMIHNLACIQQWISQCVEADTDLVLYFDGDS